jgi:hypothetical protein
LAVVSPVAAERNSEAECGVGYLPIPGVKRKLFGANGPPSAAEGGKRFAAATAATNPPSRTLAISAIDGVVDQALIDRLKVR